MRHHGPVANFMQKSAECLTQSTVYYPLQLQKVPSIQTKAGNVGIRKVSATHAWYALNANNALKQMSAGGKRGLYRSALSCSAPHTAAMV